LSDNKFPRPSKGIIEVCEDSPLAISFFFDWEIRDWCKKVRKRLEEELEDGDKVTMENCLIELVEMLDK